MAQGAQTTRDTGSDGRTGWRLILQSVRARRAGLILGVSTGLAWTAAKVSTGLIVKSAVDRGIESNDGRTRPLVTRAGHRRRVLGHLHRPPPLPGLPRGPLDRGRPARPAVRPSPAAPLRAPRLVPDRPAHEPGQHRPATGPGVRGMIPLTISNAVTVLAVTVILALIDPVLTVLALGSLPFMNVLATRFSRRLYPSVMGIQRESAELAAVVEESVAGVRVIKGLGAERVQATAEGRGRGRLRPVDGRRAHPGELPAGPRAASQHRTDRGARLRRPPGPQRQPEPRLADRIQRLHRHARLAAAHAGHDRRPGAAGGGVGRAGRRGAGHRPVGGGRAAPGGASHRLPERR